MIGAAMLCALCMWYETRWALTALNLKWTVLETSASWNWYIRFLILTKLIYIVIQFIAFWTWTNGAICCDSLFYNKNSLVKVKVASSQSPFFEQIEEDGKQRNPWYIYSRRNGKIEHLFPKFCRWLNHITDSSLDSNQDLQNSWNFDGFIY